MTHRGSYQQASSPWAGPTANDTLGLDFLFFPGRSVVHFGRLHQSRRDQLRAMGESNPLSTRKFGPDWKGIDTVITVSSNPLSGAYYLLDNEGVFFVGRGRRLRSFTDEESGNPFSDSVEVNNFPLPDWAFRPSNDTLVGLNMVIWCLAHPKARWG